MGVAERVARDLELIRSEEFAEACRSRPQDLARRRKLPHDRLVESLLARRGRTLSVELRGMRRETGVEAGKAGYLKARGKPDPGALLALVRHHASQACAGGDFETFHGMVVVGIDGSSGDVPTNEETLAPCGNASGGGAPQATIGVSSGFDPPDGQILDVALDRGSFDERSKVMGHLVVATQVTGGAPLLAVLDRGYPSLLLMAQLECAGVSYLMRRDKWFLCPESGAAEAAGGDLEVEVRLARDRLRHTRRSEPEALVALGSIRVRFALVDIGGDEPERLVTNLGEAVLPHGELREAYWMRWGFMPKSA